MEGKFIEILNWQKYQERMPTKGASWFKLHCSLANCEAFQSLEYKDQMTLIGIWMLAAESGRYILKADKKYLFRKIRILKEEPDLEPLLSAVDDYGLPNPFIRYCDVPKFDDTASDRASDRASDSASDSAQEHASERDQKTWLKVKNICDNPLYNTAVKIAAYRGYVSARNLQKKLKIGNKKANDIIYAMRHDQLLGRYVARKGWESLTALEKSKTEKIREEKIREETDSYRNPEEEREREKKTGLNTSRETQKQEKQNPSTAESNSSTITEPAHKDTQKPAKPENPMESEAAAVSTHHVPKQPSSAYRRSGIVHISDCLNQRFPEHWRDEDCQQFGWAIVEALGMQVNPDNEQMRSEWGAFASWWSRLKAVVPSVVYDELRVKAIDKARFVNSPKAKSARNKSAVWFTIMAGELNSRGITLPAPRVSPVRQA